ncbi:hypothetical protein MUN84_15890 [Hymenobacter sp. 5516J-16]|uniref:STAS/SEC14 domain-containing protein n=1 Tax=Hymenobacter sublimis TaxID=2933777 RepID=A0ABY4JCP2_9BACT|nr:MULTISPECIES: hypothetical protein [Hymenobacter]UOQ76075.1 hypothetical protein MUN84_15890 [Hymenobacter sp. 5516J-16]UPL49743.1 hypothetical protein MWH26_02245 [Hymenobacter sublimis]
MELAFENPYCHIYFDPAGPMLVQTWKGFVAGEPLREAHEATLRLLQQHGVGKVLADTRLMRVIPPADQRWIADSFLPRARALGYRLVAVVLSADMFNQISVQNILAPLAEENTLTVEYFGNLETARAWLLKAR